jgi:hypothetical protein
VKHATAHDLFHGTNQQVLEIEKMRDKNRLTARLGFWAALVLFIALQTGCASIRGQQYHHFSTPTPIEENQTLILGFLGGRENWDDASRGVRQLAMKIDSMNLPAVHIETLENRKRDLALELILNSFDSNQDGYLDERECNTARLIMYGHSLGGAAVVKLSHNLKDMGIPVLLTVQIDSVGFTYDDHVIPTNVRRAANLYQRDGWLLVGEDEIVPQDSDKTKIIANLKFDYKGKEVDMSGVPWERRLLAVPHSKMDADPEVWSTVEQFILSEIDDMKPEIIVEERVVVAGPDPRG